MLLYHGNFSIDTWDGNKMMIKICSGPKDCWKIGVVTGFQSKKASCKSHVLLKESFILRRGWKTIFSECKIQMNKEKSVSKNADNFIYKE